MSANAIEYPIVPTFEKVLVQNTLLAEKFLGIFKNMVIGNIFPDSFKNDLVQATEEYLLNSLKEINVMFPNIHELSDFLVRHFAIVNTLLEVCKYARERTWK